MLNSFLYIFFFLIIGELIKHVFNIPISGSIFGMILIYIALRIKIIELKSVKLASEKLIKYMILFFIPYGVGLMVYFDVIKLYWIVILIAVVSSTLITLYITAIIQQLFEKNE